MYMYSVLYSRGKPWTPPRKCRLVRYQVLNVPRVCRSTSDDVSPATASLSLPVCFISCTLRHSNAGGLEKASGRGEQNRGWCSGDHVMEWRGEFLSPFPSSP